MTARHHLPNRRPSITVDLKHAAIAYAVTIGYDLAGRPREIFARARRPDSHADLVADDVSVLLSITLQHNIPPDALARRLGGLHDRPALIADALVDLSAEHAEGGR
jgi:hypothetical protein